MNPPESRSRFFVYVLRATGSRRTYVGATVDPERRLRQHNGLISGGARATRSGRPWRCVAVIGGLPSWSDALKLEWRLKRGSAGGMRKRRKRGWGSDRCDQLCDVLTMERWTRSATPTAEISRDLYRALVRGR